MSDYYADVEEIVNKINDDELSDETRFMLFKFYELSGKYDKTINELST